MHRTAAGIFVGTALLASFVGIALLADEIDSNSSLDSDSRAYVWVEPATGLITIDAHNVSLASLIAEIAQSTETTYVLKSPLDELVSVQFEGLSLDRAMARLLRHESYTLQYTPPTGETSGALPRNRLWVFGGPEAATGSANQQADLADDAEKTAINLPEVERAVIERANTVATLMESEDNSTVAALAAALGDSDAATRHEAAYALGEINDPANIGLLTGALADPDPYVREAVVDAFTDIGGDASARALSVALQDEDAGLRENALYALADIGGQTAVGLLQQAQNDPDRNVRETATELLAEVGE